VGRQQRAQVYLAPGQAFIAKELLTEYSINRQGQMFGTLAWSEAGVTPSDACILRLLLKYVSLVPSPY
jgi:hypothetical protein